MNAQIDDVINEISKTHTLCDELECEICAVRDCPHKEPLHYQYGGCPACHSPKEKFKVAEITVQIAGFAPKNCEWQDSVTELLEEFDGIKTLWSKVFVEYRVAVSVCDEAAQRLLDAGYKVKVRTVCA